MRDLFMQGLGFYFGFAFGAVTVMLWLDDGSCRRGKR